MAKFITAEEYNIHIEETLNKVQAEVQKTMIPIIKKVGHELVAVEYSGRASWGRIYELRMYLKRQQEKIIREYNANALCFNALPKDDAVEVCRIRNVAVQELDNYMKALSTFNRVTTSLGTTINHLINNR